MCAPVHRPNTNTQLKSEIRVGPMTAVFYGFQVSPLSASLGPGFCVGGKTLRTAPGRPPYRGPLLLHASLFSNRSVIGGNAALAKAVTSLPTGGIKPIRPVTCIGNSAGTSTIRSIFHLRRLMMGPAARAKHTSVCSTVQSQRSMLENLPIGLMGCWSGSAIRRSEHGHQAIVLNPLPVQTAAIPVTTDRCWLPPSPCRARGIGPARFSSLGDFSLQLSSSTQHSRSCLSRF
jgi:hypothetical protein